MVDRLLRVASLFAVVAVFALVGCIEDSPTVENNVATNATTPNATTPNVSTPNVSTPNATTANNDVGFGDSCAQTQECPNDLLCLNQGGTDVCTRSCDADNPCPTGVCDAGVCWPDLADCGAGGIRQVGGCVYEDSCRDLLAIAPETPTGHYVLTPGPRTVLAWCDMDLHDGAGFTWARVDSSPLDETPQSYEAACADVGMQLIVPRTRAHHRAIIDYFGTPPTVIGAYPSTTDAARMHQFVGNCGGEDCLYYASETDTGSCQDDGLLTAGRQGPLRLEVSNCPDGKWRNSGDVVDLGYAVCSTNDARLPPFETCLEYLNANALQNRSTYGVDGVYLLSDGAEGQYAAFCDMTYAGGGWTQVAKVDGAGNGARYTSDFWLTPDPIAEPQPGVTKVQHKSQAFALLPFTQVRVLFENPDRPTPVIELSDEGSVLLAHEDTSLYDLMVRGNLVETTTSREEWLGSVPQAGLQELCNRSGFNLASGGINNHSVRIGILGNESDDCDTPDSSMGVGITGLNANPQEYQAGVAGNIGEGITRGLWTSIMVREIPVATSCDTLPPEAQGRDGIYPIAQQGDPITNTACR